ncbi:MAG: gamma-glutamyl-gamma-aminobutyrate hydrolase family protein [Clostridium sp.]
MKKLIGLIPLYDDDKDSYWMLPGYMKVLEACGALPVMLPLTTDPEELNDCFSLCDGILMTGGHDVDPALYAETAKKTCGIPCSSRDKMEAYLFEKALQEDKPVFGICRGVQLMNVLLGGTLYQDLPTEHPSKTEHHMASPYDRPVHKVTVKEETLLADIIGAGEHGVNSYHHQAVKDLAPKAEAMAYSEDGLVEAIAVPDKTFIVGVQWHPEFAFEKDPECRAIVQAFVDACSKKRILILDRLWPLG